MQAKIMDNYTGILIPLFFYAIIEIVAIVIIIVLIVKRTQNKGNERFEKRDN